jgi:hypothetical protein
VEDDGQPYLLTGRRAGGPADPDALSEPVPDEEIEATRSASADPVDAPSIVALSGNPAA